MPGYIFNHIVTKYKSLSIPVRASIWFTIVNFFTKGISFITVPIFSNILSTEEYGKVSIYLTYQGILINFATFEMYSGAYIRGILRYKNNVPFFTKSEQLLSSLITMVVFLGSIPLMPWLISKSKIDLYIYILMYLYFLFFPSYQCWIGKKRFDYDYKLVVISAVLYTLLSTIIPLIAVFTIEASSSVRIIYMLIPEIIFCIPFYLKNIQIKELISNKNTVVEQWKFLLLFQAPSVIHALSYILLSSVDRIMIGDMVGDSEAGIYSVAVTLANVITIFSISANQVLKPWRYKKMGVGEFRSIREKSNLILTAFGVIIILWIIVAPDIMNFFFQSDYYPAVWVIPPVSMSVFFVFLYSMFVDVEEYYYKTKYTMYATTISAIANVVMNYFGIKIWGYMVCAYTTLICYILLAILHLHWSNKTIKTNKNNINDVFDVNFICILSIFLIISEILITLTYKLSIIRYGLLAVLLLVGLCNLKRIKILISGFKKQ